MHLQTNDINVYKTQCVNCVRIAAFPTQRPGNQSICLPGQKILATIFVMKTQQNTLKSRDEADRPSWADRTEKYASKEECIK